MANDLRFQRTALLLGEEAVDTLSHSQVTIFGLGAVGSFCMEALARSGVGRFRLVDFDTLKATNVNRQLLALTSTMGRSKAAAAAERLLQINPQARVDAIEAFFHADQADQLLSGPPDAVVDAIDALGPKVELLRQCVARSIPVFSSMGAAARTDPSLVRVDDISRTKACPLARAVRKRLRQLGVSSGIRTVFSAEPASVLTYEPQDLDRKDPEPEFHRGRPRRVLPSLVVLPGIFGLTLAGEVIRFLAQGA